MSASQLVAAILLVCGLSLSAAQNSCKKRCGMQYYRGNTCQCDYSCLLYEECCKDYESTCTTKDSCKGRCGESFKRGRKCSCDSDCVEYNQCCPDYKKHCDEEEPTPVATEDPIVSEGNEQGEDFIPSISPSSELHDDPSNDPIQIFHNGEVEGPESGPTSETNSGFEPTPELLEEFATGPSLTELDGFEITAEAFTVLPETQTTTSKDEPNKADTSLPTLGPSLEELSVTENTDADDLDEQPFPTIPPTVDPEPTKVTQTSSDPTPEPSSDTADLQTGPTQPDQSVTDTPETTVPSSEMTELRTLDPKKTDTPDKAEESTTTTAYVPSPAPENPETYTLVPDSTSTKDETTLNPEMDATDSPNPSTLALVEVVSEVSTMATTNAEQDAEETTPEATTTEASKVTPSPTSPSKTTSEPEMDATYSPNPSTLALVEEVSEVSTMATTNAEQDAEEITPEATTAEALQVTPSPTSPSKTTSEPEMDGTESPNPSTLALVEEVSEVSTMATTNAEQDAEKITPEANTAEASKVTPSPTSPSKTTSEPEMDATESPNPSTLALVEEVSEVSTMATTNAEQDAEETTPEATTAEALQVTPSPTSPFKTTSKPKEKPNPEMPLPSKPVLKPDTKPVTNEANLDNTREYQADDSNDTDLCSGRPVGGVTTLSNGTIVVFRGHFFWVLDRNRVPGPARGITQVWGVPSPIDTVFTRCNCEGKTYIFKGPQYWRFENDALDPGFPKVVVAGFDGLRGHITAALSVPQYNRRRESVYFFKRGGNVQKYSYHHGTNPSCGRKVKVHYAIYTVRNRIARQASAQVSLLGPSINIRTSWKGFPTTITAAVSIPNKREPEGYSYHVFSRTKSYNIRMDGERPVIAAPKPNTSPRSNDVFKCPKKVAQPQLRP